MRSTQRQDLCHVVASFVRFQMGLGDAKKSMSLIMMCAVHFHSNSPTRVDLYSLLSAVAKVNLPSIRNPQIRNPQILDCICYSKIIIRSKLNA